MSRRWTRTTTALVVSALLAWPAVAQRRAPVAFAWAEAIKGEEESELRWPVALAAGPDGGLLVADAYGSRLVAFQEEASGWQASGSVELPGVPTAMTHDGSRYLVALRTRNQVMEVEIPTLRLRPVPLPVGVVPGAIAGRRGGGLLVFDHAAGAILMLDARGRPEGALEVDRQITALTDRPDGGFSVALVGPAEIRSFDAAGEPLAERPVAATTEAPAWPSGLAATEGGDLLVVDGHAARLLVLDSGGRLAGIGSRKGWEPGLLYFPTGIARLPDGRIAVADQGNGRVQLFRRTDQGTGR